MMGLASGLFFVILEMAAVLYFLPCLNFRVASKTGIQVIKT